MKATTAIASLLAAAACVSANSVSYPVLAFTSQQASSTKLQLPTDSSLTGFVDSLLISGRTSPVCNLDAIAFVHADQLDRDTFASLRHSSTHSLRARSLGAPSQVTFNAAPGAERYSSLVSRISKECGFGRTEMLELRASHEVLRSEHKVFAHIDAGDIRKQESALLQTLESLDEAYPRNLVIVTHNDRMHQHAKRQYVAEPLASSGNWTEPQGGVFAKYQLFSTPLILTLLLVGGLLLPIVYFAVSQLAQVQTPDQMGVRKDPISGDRKTQ
ncbi:hypothetical protein EX895_000131 [Sporisorium graminicola]|uniref:Protein BIG1 n=1 Tax=Sporisorium graminicola TaxID=280036 RepID=A0A4U7KZB4_9BASI|nr:hypothetical protein EX895_000131 [Sporisorium graminicola]TKY90133.1 hypothetical protein EX895_000131 [Sporisorium graminicola]